MFLSQNFIRNKNLAAHIVGLVSFGINDLVIDIGAGMGNLTRELARVCGRVLAVEIDSDLIPVLAKNLATNVTIYNQDFLAFNLPRTPYKVFANLPFHITAEIVKKLLGSKSPPVESYLIMQKEAAQKFSGTPHETQFSLLDKPYFNFETVYIFKKSDFDPEPDVETVLLKIVKRNEPLVTKANKILYQNFIKFAFNTWKKDLKVGLKKTFTYEQWKRLAKDNNFNIHAKPTDLSFPQWLKLFEFYKTRG